MTENKTDFSGETYASAGVSINAQNKVNLAVAKKLKDLGMKADGLFGGAVDVSQYKGLENVFLNVSGSELISHDGIDMIKNIKEMGRKTARAAFEAAGGTPIGTLDYIASKEMDTFVADFVEGVALESLEKKCIVLGGESAQMKDTYREGAIDAFVHVISIGGKPSINIAPLISRMNNPLVVATTDGTGTKTKKIRNPEDIIYHGFNDLGAQGVEPIAFALYIGGNVPRGDLEAIDSRADSISKNLGVKKLDSIIAWRGDLYLPDRVDIAGTVVGVSDHSKLITGKDVKPGDLLIGVQVDGCMTNGFSLAINLGEKLIQSGEVESWESPVDYLGGKSLLHEITLPHRPMTDILFGYEGVEGVLSKYNVKGMAHITGGGQPDNMIRMIPDSCKVVVEKRVLKVPPLMELFLQHGLSEDEADSAFNMGVGYTLTVDQEIANEVIGYINTNFKDRIPGVERVAAQIGVVKYRNNNEPKFEFGKL